MNLPTALPVLPVVSVQPILMPQSSDTSVDFAALVESVKAMPMSQPAQEVVVRQASEKTTDAPLALPFLSAVRKEVQSVLDDDIPDEKKLSEDAVAQTLMPAIHVATALVASVQPSSTVASTPTQLNTAVTPSVAKQSSVAQLDPGLPRFARGGGGLNSSPIAFDEAQAKSSPERGGGGVADGGVECGMAKTALVGLRPLRPLEGAPPRSGEDFEVSPNTGKNFAENVITQIPKKADEAAAVMSADKASEPTFTVAITPETRPSITAPQPVITATPANPEAPIDRHLNLARDSAWLDDLARDIVSAGSTSDRLSFRLSPEGLGRLDIALSQSANGLSVQMSTSTDDATQIISAAQPRLIEELRHHGVRVADAGVATGGQQQSPTPQTRQPLQQIEHASFDHADDTKTPNDTRPKGRFA